VYINTCAPLRSSSFGRQAESRKTRLDHLKMKLGMNPFQMEETSIRKPKPYATATIVL
jgi:hypothetical protein